MASDLAFLSALPDGAMLLDVAGRVEAANARADDMLQVRLAGLNALNVLRLPAFSEAVEKCWQGGGEQTVEIEIRSAPPRLLEAHVARLGEDSRVLVVLRDLTREQQIERMRSDFVANASHEIARRSRPFSAPSKPCRARRVTMPRRATDSSTPCWPRRGA